MENSLHYINVDFLTVLNLTKKTKQNFPAIPSNNIFSDHGQKIFFLKLFNHQSTPSPTNPLPSPTNPLPFWRGVHAMNKLSKNLARLFQDSFKTLNDLRSDILCKSLTRFFKVIRKILLDLLRSLASLFKNLVRI